MVEYKLINRKEDIASKIRRLHQEIKLSVCIIDNNNDVNTISCINFFSQIDCNIFVAIEDDKIRLKKLTSELTNVNFLVFPSSSKYSDIFSSISKECYSTYFLVVDSNIVIDYLDLDSILNSLDSNKDILCIAPRLYNKLYEKLPSISVPYISKKKLEIVNFLPEEEKDYKTLFPFAGIGFYNRALFQRLRELDSEISSFFYQEVDMGLTTYLFGYSIINSNLFKAHYISNKYIIEDRTECKGLDRLYTKAMCVKRIGGKNQIKKWGKYSNSKYLKEVEKRILLYKTDIFKLIDDWQLV